MASTQGDFIWYELITSDVDAAVDFYGAVLGWRPRPEDGALEGYRILGTEADDVAGMMAIPEDAGGAGMAPVWLPYIAVDDVDAEISAIQAAQGSLRMHATDIPGIGRFALVADPQGVAFYIMRPEEGESKAFDMKSGHCQWNELSTSDPAAALDFYGKRYGWEKGEAMPMGENGEYQFITKRDQHLGAVAPCAAGGVPMWTFYFGVDDIDKAGKITTDKGGTIHHGPEQVPGGIYIIVASDPQGAMFGLVGERVGRV